MMRHPDKMDSVIFFAPYLNFREGIADGPFSDFVEVTNPLIFEEFEDVFYEIEQD